MSNAPSVTVRLDVETRGKLEREVARPTAGVVAGAAFDCRRLG